MLNNSLRSPASPSFASFSRPLSPLCAYACEVPFPVPAFASTVEAEATVVAARLTPSSITFRAFRIRWDEEEKEEERACARGPAVLDAVLDADSSSLSSSGLPSFFSLDQPTHGFGCSTLNVPQCFGDDARTVTKGGEDEYARFVGCQRQRRVGSAAHGQYTFTAATTMVGKSDDVRAVRAAVDSDVPLHQQQQHHHNHHHHQHCHRLCQENALGELIAPGTPAELFGVHGGCDGDFYTDAAAVDFGLVDKGPLRMGTLAPFTPPLPENITTINTASRALKCAAAAQAGLMVAALAGDSKLPFRSALLSPLTMTEHFLFAERESLAVDDALNYEFNIEAEVEGKGAAAALLNACVVAGNDDPQSPLFRLLSPSPCEPPYSASRATSSSLSSSVTATAEEVVVCDNVGGGLGQKEKKGEESDKQARMSQQRRQRSSCGTVPTDLLPCITKLPLLTVPISLHTDPTATAFMTDTVPLNGTAAAPPIAIGSNKAATSSSSSGIAAFLPSFFELSEYSGGGGDKEERGEVDEVDDRKTLRQPACTSLHCTTCSSAISSSPHQEKEEDGGFAFSSSSSPFSPTHTTANAANRTKMELNLGCSRGTAEGNAAAATTTPHFSPSSWVGSTREEAPSFFGGGEFTAVAARGIAITGDDGGRRKLACRKPSMGCCDCHDGLSSGKGGWAAGRVRGELSTPIALPDKIRRSSDVGAGGGGVDVGSWGLSVSAVSSALLAASDEPSTPFSASVRGGGGAHSDGGGVLVILSFSLCCSQPSI